MILRVGSFLLVAAAAISVTEDGRAAAAAVASAAHEGFVVMYVGAGNFIAGCF